MTEKSELLFMADNSEPATYRTGYFRSWTTLAGADMDSKICLSKCFLIWSLQGLTEAVDPLQWIQQEKKRTHNQATEDMARKLAEPQHGR